MTTESH